MKTLIQIKNLTIGHKDRTLFSSANFDICEGECIMLCGANGSGKTTLMKTIASRAEGVITAEGCKTVMIPSRIPKIKGFTLREFVRISCYDQSDMGGRLSDEQEISLENAIGRMGLMHLADRDIATLSEGEFQKAGIASALVRNADVIMLDEPTAFLDAENRISILQTLRNLCYDHTCGKRAAVIFSTHDLTDGLAVADKVIALGADGELHCEKKNLEAAVHTIFNRP